MFHILHLYPLSLPFLQNRPGKRVLTFGFQRSRQRQQPLFRNALGRNPIRNPGLPLRNGSGFVQDHNVRLSGLFQTNRGFEQDAVFRAHTVANHNCHRCGKSQGAGTADNQHGNASCQGKAKISSQQQPEGGCQDRNGDHHRHEHTGHLVRKLGNGGLGCCRIADHLNDLRKGGILPHPGGPAAQKAGLVYGSRGNTLPGSFVHRNALPGQGRLVDGTGSFQYHTVHRDTFTGADHKFIPLSHLLDGDRFLFPIPQKGCRFRRQLHEAL